MDSPKRMPEEDGALVPVKRPRQDIVAAEQKGKSIIPAVFEFVSFSS
jgi:hypothetical protein